MTYLELDPLAQYQAAAKEARLCADCLGMIDPADADMFTSLATEQEHHIEQCWNLWLANPTLHYYCVAPSDIIDYSI